MLHVQVVAQRVFNNFEALTSAERVCEGVFLLCCVVKKNKNKKIKKFRHTGPTRQITLSVHHSVRTSASYGN
jgi:hypothetical protein